MVEVIADGVIVLTMFRSASRQETENVRTHVESLFPPTWRLELERDCQTDIYSLTASGYADLPGENFEKLCNILVGYRAACVARLCNLNLDEESNLCS